VIAERPAALNQVPALPQTARPFADLITLDCVEALAVAFLAGYTGHTRDAYRRDLADWWHWCAAHDLAVLEAARVHVELYARELEAVGRAPSTVARHLAALAGFYQYAVGEGVLVRSPVAHVRRPKVADDSQTTGLDRDQLRAVLAEARRRATSGRGAGVGDLALVTLLAHNGLRIGEALAADVKDLGAERGHRVLCVTRKGGRRATVVLAPVTARVLDDYLAGRTSGPLFTTATGRSLDEPAAFRMVRRLARAAGVAGAEALSPHSFRHAFVTAALDAGVSLRDVQDAAGHADPRTTRRYDRARHSLDRHATYAVAAWLSEDG
jgi:integrase/recombinase XerD